MSAGAVGFNGWRRKFSRRHASGLPACAAVAALATSVWTDAGAAEAPPSLFDNVVDVLSRRYYDGEFIRDELPRLVRRYSPKAERAAGPDLQRMIVHDFLSNIPATHLALLSDHTYRRFRRELSNEPVITFGFELVQRDGKYFAYNILDGGPADAAGLRRWDRVVSIDGIAPRASLRLDWRTDDAFHADPPLHPVLAGRADVIEVKAERTPGQFVSLTVRARPYSTFEAARAGARTFDLDGRRIGYLHLWMVPHDGADTLLRTAVERHCRECDGFVLDLRGRGGSAAMIERILDVLADARARSAPPFAVLGDRQTRSAKEILAYEIRERGLGILVGEKTAGAVIPATFADVGYETYLMFPASVLPRYTRLLEGHGVPPDVPVEDAGPYSAGHDPILLTGLRTAAVLADAPEQTP